MSLQALFASRSVTGQWVAQNLPFVTDPALFDRVDNRRQPLPLDVAQQIATLFGIDVAVVRQAAGYCTNQTGRRIRQASPADLLIGEKYTPKQIQLLNETTIQTTSMVVGGDLSGTLPDPTVVGWQDRPIASTTPTVGQVYVWTGINWAPETLPAGSVTPGTNGQVFMTEGGVSGWFPQSDIVHANLANLTADDHLQYLRTDGTRTLTGNMSIGGFVLTNSAAPVNPGDLANKAYVDASAQGIAVKPAVQVMSTSNLTLSGEQTIDGVLTSSSRMLLTGQTTGSQNGIWVTGSGAWTRPTDFSAGASAAAAYTFVQSGTNHANQGWYCTTLAPNAVIGTNSLTFVQFSAAGSFTAGNGLQLTGNTFSVKAADTTINVSGSGIKVGSITTSNVTASGTNSQSLVTTWSAAVAWQTLTLGATAPIAVSNSGNVVYGTTISVANATTGAVGVIQLAGDLGGTATSPTVQKLQGATLPSPGAVGTVLQVSATNVLSYALVAPASLTLGGANTVLQGGASANVWTATPTVWNLTAQSVLTANGTGASIVAQGAGSYIQAADANGHIETTGANGYFAGMGNGAYFQWGATATAAISGRERFQVGDQLCWYVPGFSWSFPGIWVDTSSYLQLGNSVLTVKPTLVTTAQNVSVTGSSTGFTASGADGYFLTTDSNGYFAANGANGAFVAQGANGYFAASGANGYFAGGVSPAQSGTFRAPATGSYCFRNGSADVVGMSMLSGGAIALGNAGTSFAIGSGTYTRRTSGAGAFSTSQNSSPHPYGFVDTANFNGVDYSTVGGTALFYVRVSLSCVGGNSGSIELWASYTNSGGTLTIFDQGSDRLSGSQWYSDVGLTYSGTVIEVSVTPYFAPGTEWIVAWDVSAGTGT